jgi:hypothetical protein
MSHTLPFYSALLTIIMAFVLMIFAGGIAITPTSFWFHYDYINPVQESFSTGEQVAFVSAWDSRDGINVHWNDIMRCDLPDDEFSFGYFSVSNTNADDLRARDSSIPEIWTYGDRIPVSGATCYVDSTITVDLPFGISKSQKIKSGNFKIQ